MLLEVPSAVRGKKAVESSETVNYSLGWGRNHIVRDQELSRW